MGFAERIYQAISTKNTISILVITIAISLSYSNNLFNSFIWDDEFLIEKNIYLTDINYAGKIWVSNSTAGFGGKDNFYRPTQNFYYLLIYQMFGKSEVAFHLGNILLHLANSILLFYLVRRFSKNNFIALASSLLWALHPAHVEAVTYISGTADPMSVLFLLLCLLSYPFYEKAKPIRAYGLPLLFYTLALLSKESLIIAPGLIVLLQMVISEKKWKWRTYLPTLPFWVVSFIYLLLRKTVLNFNNTFNFYQATNIYTENILFRFYTYLATLPEYAKILFYPIDLHMERNFPVYINFLLAPVLVGLTIFIFSLGFALFSLWKDKNWIYIGAWLWFFIAFVPMNGILLPVNSLILEHWLYLPSIAVCGVVAFLLAQLTPIHKWLPLSLLAIMASGLIFLVHMRNRDWSTPVVFYNNILQYGEGSARVHNNLAMAYNVEKRFDQAMAHYQKAIAISDVYPQTHFNLARLYLEKHDFNMAFFHIDRSLEIDPQFTHALQLRHELLDFLNPE